MFVSVDLDSGDSRLEEGERPDDELDEECADGVVELIKYTDGAYHRWNGREWTRIN